MGYADWVSFCYLLDGSTLAGVELGGENDGKATGLEACIGECDNDGQCKEGSRRILAVNAGFAICRYTPVRRYRIWGVAETVWNGIGKSGCAGTV